MNIAQTTLSKESSKQLSFARLAYLKVTFETKFSYLNKKPILINLINHKQPLRRISK